MTTRREILLAIGAGALAPQCAFAQAAPRRIAYLQEYDGPRSGRYIAAFKSGMRELGYVDGKDFVVEMHAANTAPTQLPELAGKLVAAKYDILLSSGTPSALALQKATREIPILITSAGDPVATGMAAALNRPGGNITGLTGQATDLTTKRLDLLRQILPGLRRVGYLHNPGNARDIAGLKQFESDCRKIGVQPILAALTKREDVSVVFDAMKKSMVQATVVTGAATNYIWVREIVDQALHTKIPAIHSRSDGPDAGGLFSYGTDAEDLYRRAAAYAVKIFKGEKPGNIPIEQPTKFDFVINMKTARALGLKVPNSVLVQATKVIE